MVGVEKVLSSQCSVISNLSGEPTVASAYVYFGCPGDLKMQFLRRGLPYFRTSSFIRLSPSGIALSLRVVR